jgi:ABC-2 type transport system permease protein
MNARRWSLQGARRLLRVYGRLQLTQLRTVVEYRADFWIGILGAALMHGSGLVFLYAFFGQVDAIGGWSAWEVAILYGLATIPVGLREMFCDGPWLLRAMVNRGDFDRVLVTPISPALSTATMLASIHGIGQVILGATGLWLGLGGSDIDWTWWKPLYLGVIVVSNTVLLATLAYLVNMIGFWEPSAQSALPTAYALMIDFAKFPLDIYSTVIKFLVTVVAPFAFVSYFPALVLLDSNSDLRWLGFGSPAVTGIVVLLTSWLWSKALNRYQGVGH